MALVDILNGDTGASVRTTLNLAIDAVNNLINAMNATVTVSTPLLNMSQTWNNSGVVFTAAKLNVTDSASDAASILMDLQVASASVFKVSSGGELIVKTGVSQYAALTINTGKCVIDYTGTINLDSGASYIIENGLAKLGLQSGDALLQSYQDLLLNPGGYAAGPGKIVSILNGTTATTLRVYNTYTNSSNYERGIFDWNATPNTLTIGTEAAGTGTERALTLNAASPMNFNLPSGGSAYFNFGGAPAFGIRQSIDGIILYPTWKYMWGDSNATSSPDTGISRPAAGVIALGNGTLGDASATITAKTKAGAPTTSDVPAGTWVLIRDTINATTAIYYNNAGSLQSIALT